MSARNAKRACESSTEQTYILMPQHINGYGRLFGGRLMEWIDVTAGVVARRHCQHNVTTVAVDNLQFHGPAHENDTVVICGRVTHVGRTSMEIRVEVFVENMDGSRKFINRAYLVMVALDENEKPTPVPGLIIETDEDRSEWEGGLLRDRLRKQRRKEEF